MIWEPDWTPPLPAPKGDDEDEVRACYEGEVGPSFIAPWESMDEWKREAWRRDHRARDLG